MFNTSSTAGQLLTVWSNHLGQTTIGCHTILLGTKFPVLCSALLLKPFRTKTYLPVQDIASLSSSYCVKNVTSVVIGYSFAQQIHLHYNSMSIGNGVCFFKIITTITRLHPYLLLYLVPSLVYEMSLHWTDNSKD